MACSQIWLPVISQQYLEWTLGWQVDHYQSSEGIWVRGLDVVETEAPSNLTSARQQQRIIELQARVRELEKTLRQANISKKEFGQDLKLLKVNLLGEILRKGHEVGVIDAGLDFGVSKNDWLVVGRELVGRVVSLSESCALVEAYTQSGVQSFVTVDGLDGEFLWEGQGKNHAVIYIKGSINEEVLNRRVYLSGARSREGSLQMGEVIGMQKDQQGGWWKLIVKGRKMEVDDILFVVQRIDPEMSQLFGNRDQIAELKERLRRMELDKLRLELTKD
jgi:hypothetical protein